MTYQPPYPIPANSAQRGAGQVYDRPVGFGSGLVALDIIISGDPGREPVLAAGGTCANVLTALSYLGWDTFPIARLDGDAASKLVRADLARWGVALDFATLTPSSATPIIVQTIRHNRHGSPMHRFSLACPACGAWFPSFRAVTSAAAHQVIDAIAGVEPSGFAPRIFFFDRVSRGALLLARAFAARGALVVFEPSGVGDPKLFAEALAVTHILKYSQQRLPNFAERQFGGPPLLLEIETCGAEGLRYRSGLLPSRRWRMLDAIRAPQVVDTAGAGDWCTAGLLYRLAHKGVSGLENSRPGDLADSIRFGQAAAAIACGYEGARGVMYEISCATFSRAVAALLGTESGTEFKVLAGVDEVVTQTTLEEKEARGTSLERRSKGAFASKKRNASFSRRSPLINKVCPRCG